MHLEGYLTSTTSPLAELFSEEHANNLQPQVLLDLLGMSG